MQRGILLIIIASVIASFFYFDAGQYINLDYFNHQRALIDDFQQQRPVLVAIVYFLIYVLVTALSLPGAAVMTLVGGAIFGFGWGLLLVSFASSVGASLAFVIARSLLRDWVQQRFSEYLGVINKGVEKNGAFYLFTLRLVPLFPFVIINLAMALTPIRLWPFYWVSQLGMLAGTAVYVNAGTQLAQLDGTAGILSPQLVMSFVLLGLFPWLAKILTTVIKRRMVLSTFQKPKKFDNNLLVVGAGSAGLVSAYIAATVNATVTLIEKNAMGGDCLNTGCVPSKAIIRSSRINHYMQSAAQYGINVEGSTVDFNAVMQRVQQIIKKIEPHDSVQRYSELGVNCVQGAATIISPWEVEVALNEGGKQIFSAKNIIIASGGSPVVPDVPGIEQVSYLTSESLWQLQKQPNRLLVVGGGPIGCELAQAFHRLGSEVTMLVRGQLLPKEDDDVANEVEQQFRRDGIRVLCQAHLMELSQQGDEKVIRASINQSDEINIASDQVLFAVGRRANTEGLGLDNVGISVNGNGSVAVDKYLRTDCPTIYACGDVAGPYQFTHVAAHQAWYAAVNSLFGSFKKFKADYSVIPWVTFCSPEVARVGLSEKEAHEKNIAYELTRYELEDLDRAIADGEAHGFIKVLTAPGKDKILGVTIVGYHASELIAEYILAMRHGLGLNKILSTIHIYPTLSEANKYVAGNWKKAHKPEILLRWLRKFHKFRL